MGTMDFVAASKGEVSFADLPDVAVSIIFDHLNAADHLLYRIVCRDWRERLTGSVGIRFTECSRIIHFEGDRNGVRKVYLKGRKVSHDASRNAVDSNLKQKGLIRKRIRGHLPEPVVLSDAEEYTCEDPLEFCQLGTAACVFRMEDQSAHWQALDLSLSSCLVMRASCVNGTPRLRLLHQTPLLKRVICELEMSGLRRLERVSVRGCGALRKIQLPPSLVSLDASGCTQLATISLPFGQRAELEALNLSGCRSLSVQGSRSLFGAARLDVMRCIRELDLSSTNRLPKEILAGALKATEKLESVSLRYVSTDEVVLALSKSRSAQETLKFVDTSFSSNIEDSSVEQLVNSARNLVRFNLRACSVSALCYNAVPVQLERRRQSPSEISHRPFSLREEEKKFKKRKGDNIFFFVDR